LKEHDFKSVLKEHDFKSVLKEHDFKSVLKGHGFSRAANTAENVRALAPEACLRRHVRVGGACPKTMDFRTR
jgi:hypothetical protein